MGTVNEDDLDWSELNRGRTTIRRKPLGEAAGGERLGASLYELPPGRRSCPYHYHEGNEEALYVLAGAGTIRLPGETLPLEVGDYAAFPADERGAHRVINDTDEPLRYLMFSTMDDPDVAIYPDSNKFGVFAGAPPGSHEERTVDGTFRPDDDVDYWAGEEDDD